MNNIIPNWSVSNQHILDRMVYCHVLVILIAADIGLWLEESGYNLRITSSVRPDNSKIGVSKTHQTGRAVDISTWDEVGKSRIPDEILWDLITHFNKKYEDVAAVSSKTGKPTLIVRHGPPDHLHIQIHHRYTMPRSK